MGRAEQCGHIYLFVDALNVCTKCPDFETCLTEFELEMEADEI